MCNSIELQWISFQSRESETLIRLTQRHAQAPVSQEARKMILASLVNINVTLKILLIFSKV